MAEAKKVEVLVKLIEARAILKGLAEPDGYPGCEDFGEQDRFTFEAEAQRLEIMLTRIRGY